MRVRILGAAAGGGLPQWNCNCNTCAAAAAGQQGVRAQTQSSIAIKGERGAWFLVNCSPDVRQQLQTFPVAWTTGGRTAPFAAVVVTDAEVDHTAGLLLLRESSTPLHVYCTDAVQYTLTEDFPILRMLESYCGVTCSTLAPGSPVALPESSLELTPFHTGRHTPRYANNGSAGTETIGLLIRDRVSDRTLAYAPCVDEFDDALADVLARADCVMVDGTFWHDEELIALGVGDRTARAMGHVPLAGAGGSLARLADRDARTILVHVNNTNPVWFPDSDERAQLVRAGVELAHDGMELAVP